MIYLVTGAAGFIGSHLSEALLAAEHDVIGIDNFDSFYSRKIKESNLQPANGHESFTFHEVDIENYEALFNITAKYDISAIIHLAAKAGVRPSIIDPIGYQNVNVGGTQNMLEIARHQNIKKFIYGSSSSVYGINPNCPWKEEDFVLRPISPYASSKVSGELLGHVYSQIFNVQFIALRFFTVYGPRQRPDLAIHKFVAKIINGESIPVYGDGTTSRDYTYVADIVNGIRLALNYEGSQYIIFNLGNQRNISLSDLIMTIEDVVEKKATIDRQKQQPGDVKITNADISKASRLLNYHPETKLRDGIKQFKEWYELMMKEGLV